jgi:CCR4-NOT transcription complex subunit 6
MQTLYACKKLMLRAIMITSDQTSHTTTIRASSRLNLEQERCKNTKPSWWMGVQLFTRIPSKCSSSLADNFLIFTRYIMLDKQIVNFANVAINRPDMKGEHDIFNRVMPKDEISVVTFFENRLTGTRVIVVNVHICWDPQYKDVKVVQVAIMLEQLAKYSEKYAKWPACTDKAAFRHSEPTVDGEEDSLPEPPPDPKPSLEYATGSAIPLVLCGDFNSMTDSGVYDLLANGALASTHSDLTGRTYGNFTRDGMTHPFMLKSAYANMGELSFTNYTPDFTAVIGFIWYSTNSLEAVGLLGELDQEYLQRVPGFPHYHFPSDHLPLLAQFSVKPQTKSKPITRPDFGPQRDRR